MIRGLNFEAGAAVDFGQGIRHVSTSYVMPSEMLVNIAIQSDAVAGPRVVTVTNPGGLSGGSANGAFSLSLVGGGPGPPTAVAPELWTLYR